MKSLTLHLIVILLLGSLQYNAINFLPRTVATATSTSTSTSTSSASPSTEPTITAVTTTRTTLQSPSLRKPQRQLAATTTMTSIRRRSQLAHANTAAAATATAAIEDDAAKFDSTRLVRNATKIIARKEAQQQKQLLNSVRQNRSLQSSNTNNSNNNNNAAADSSKSNNTVDKKIQRLQRRQPLRSSQNSNIARNAIKITSSSSSSSAAAAAAASLEAIATKESSEAAAATTRTSSSSEEKSEPSFMASHRQLKKLQQQQQQQQEHELQQNQQQVDDAVEAQHLSKQQQQHRTTKTPRMIQRLVAGHIQNAEGRSTYEVSAVSTNSSNSNTTTTLNPNPLYFRRKSAMISSSYRQTKSNATTTTTTTTTTQAPLKLKTITPAADEHDDDEALLDDPGDFDNWDHGILRLSAGSGKENSQKSKKNKEDSKKTLSDQVRDGKYGLIEKELFRRQPKRPGVLSYLPNKEVPIDNERNFGGLNEDDIWLAEDHLLVIKGGSLNEDEPYEPWPAIDDYDAPGRQIKIPAHPKVPPPFPVQLEENGPLQFIGNNKFTVVYPVANETVPVYTAGIENNYAPSESDDEKNLLTRPGASQDTPAEAEPGYLYPAPYPPWLYHNQTFVNPALKNARPISFPGLGPFPFRRNGSLENINDTVDYFDEDDHSLYYPPAYSFVYKNNYSNPVPPGPLVPGIVLPPPPDQFSRLEKSSKGSTSTTSTPPPTRQRIYSTTASTTSSSTSTTTTTTTTESPFRQVLTKISEYTPKTITITTAPPTPRPLPEIPPTPPPTSTPAVIEPVPVPVAVPVPIYPSKHYSTTRPNIVSFVPTTPEPTVETFSKSNPIYYEYFEAKREPTTANVIDDFIPTTAKPTLSAKPVKIYATSKRPYKHRNYLQQISANRPYVPQENVVYITPKPEIRTPYNYKVPPLQQGPIYKPRPLENFEREVNAIRETLRYYQNQQLRDNNIPRTPKAKTIYEYSFDATKEESPGANNFQPPSEFDEEPFKPMVTYSPPVDDENAFRAIAYEKADREPLQQQQQPAVPKYQSTTTLIPVQPSPQYQGQGQGQGRPKKLRLGAAKYLEQPLNSNGYQQQYPIDYQSTPRTILTTQPSWVSLDKQQSLVEYQPQELQPPQNQQHSPAASPKSRIFPGYYYGPPPPPHRQNNRFYDEPFQNPVRKIVNNYRPPPPPPPQQQQYPVPHQQEQQQQQQNVWSLENDTYVNYAPNRPPLNPDAEFINPYQNIPLNPYATQQNQRYGPPALSHQSQYYGPPPPQRYPQRQQAAQPQAPAQIPLHRDILVNYRQPLPPINPDSEYISHPQVVRNPSSNPVYRPSNTYRLPAPAAAPQAAIAGEQSNIYYITPKYRRGSNGNNNNNNGGNRQ